MQITGYILGFGVLAAVLLLNRWVFRRNWRSYPTAAEYLAAHPGARNAGEIVCHTCKGKPASLGLRDKDRLYRCAFCETELYRVDLEG
ncbi:MAG TPA: hypothetical protein VGM25_13050 [Caulobacteraceae bacterium]